jgi:D-alanyl-lipoteichoic acid acyltransferase DltB (MBOAT superfamily)
MTLTHIGVFAAFALLYCLLIPSQWRGWALMVVSVVALYWMQPAIIIRRMDFVFPSLTLFLTILVWMLTRQQEKPINRADRLALGISLGVVVLISLTRYLIPELRPTPSRPPAIAVVLLGMALLMGVALLISWMMRLLLTMALVILVFVIFKTEALTEELSAGLRSLAGQDVDLASASDLQWLGFSYIAFRLIHVLRDRQTGILPDMSLREHLTYAIFFPAFTAGPIDRAERHLEDDRALAELRGMDAHRWTEGLGRIAIGIGKKFVLADSLALIALNETNATQATNSLGLWVLLYAFAFRLYLDFSGYSDIAIGLGYLVGIRLPENFNRPYLKTSITEFWQSWHITLSNWVRFYVFSPLSRSLLRRKPGPNSQLIVLVAQLTTMLVIGLWHQVTVNFVIWGLWHGIGLFIHKMWSDRTRRTYFALNPNRKRAWNIVAWLVTFHFVVIGWVWFSLPDFSTASDVFAGLFGVGR